MNDKKNSSKPGHPDELSMKEYAQTVERRYESAQKTLDDLLVKTCLLALPFAFSASSFILNNSIKCNKILISSWVLLFISLMGVTISNKTSVKAHIFELEKNQKKADVYNWWTNFLNELAFYCLIIGITIFFIFILINKYNG